MIVATLADGTRHTFRSDDAFLDWQRHSHPGEAEGTYAVAEIASLPSCRPLPVRSAPERAGPSS